MLRSLARDLLVRRAVVTVSNPIFQYIAVHLSTKESTMPAKKSTKKLSNLPRKVSAKKASAIKGGSFGTPLKK